MKKIIIFIILVFSFNSFANTSSPRSTMKTFLKAMVKVKSEQGDIKSYYNEAITTLEINELDKNLKFDIGKKYSKQLINTIDKIKRVKYNEIPAVTTKTRWYFDQRTVNNIELEISLVLIDKQWLFSKETLKSLDSYEEHFRGKRTVRGVVKLTTFEERVEQALPPVFAKKYFLFFNWQWLGIVLLIAAAFLLQKIFDFFLTILLNKYFEIVKQNSNSRLKYALKPLNKIIFLFIVLKLFPYLEFNVSGIAITKRVLYIVLSCYTVWFGHRMIELLSYYATQKATETETKFDDILVPLITKTAYVIIYILGGILIANSLTINVSGLIAGLGIGGLAFAFAAKDTLANFFGSIMLVLDRPFDIGDVIVAGDIEGTVTEVGFRSTRIRTFNDSLITVSNGMLMNRPIDNRGKRRFRRLVTTLGLEYNTPPAKIEAFCEGVRQLIIDHKWTRKDSFYVYFTEFAASSLNIQLVCYWETEDYAREQAEKHRLLLDILRLADEIGVAFAFPTQTIHLFNEDGSEVKDIDGEFREIGRQKAKNVLDKPITLKNPRSNSLDEDQFGKNEI